jgi:hypothetical protein
LKWTMIKNKKHCGLAKTSGDGLFNGLSSSKNMSFIFCTNLEDSMEMLIP